MPTRSLPKSKEEGMRQGRKKEMEARKRSRQEVGKKKRRIVLIDLHLCHGDLSCLCSHAAAVWRSNPLVNVISFSFAFMQFLSYQLLFVSLFSSRLSLSCRSCPDKTVTRNDAQADPTVRNCYCISLGWHMSGVC